MIRWTTAFVDMPPASFEAGVAFWQRVTGTERSAPRGPAEQFATLLPGDGDGYLRVQRHDGAARIHLDLHVDDVAAVAAVAVRLGATEVADLGYRILRSPTGFVFCVVPHRGECEIPGPVVGPAGACRVDQLALDIPAVAFAPEALFWTGLTGWARRQASRPEFELLERPPALPMRTLLHRLGPADPRRDSSAHLDIAGGEHVRSLAQQHVEWGAEVVRVEEHWTTLRDPAGLPYCITRRDPLTGTLPASRPAA